MPDENDKQSEDEISEDYSDEGNIDSSENGDGDDDLGGGEDSEDEAPAKKKRKLRDAREGKTIFIRNLPFDATEEEISALVESFGEIAYCKIVVDSVTEHSRGSAFVKFEEKQSADDCLKKHGDETKGSEGMNLTILLFRVGLG